MGDDLSVRSSIAELEAEVRKLEFEVEDLEQIYTVLLLQNGHLPRQDNTDDRRIDKELVQKAAGGWVLCPSRSHVKYVQLEPQTILRFCSEWSHPDIADVEVEMTGETVDDEWIKDLKIVINQRDSSKSLFQPKECRPLIGYCQRHKLTLFFFRHLEELFRHFNRRQKVLDSNAHKDVIRHDPGRVGKEQFSYVVGRPDDALAYFVWNVNFDVKSLSVKDTVKVDFTDAGRKLATECNFPAELMETGTCWRWSAEKHVNVLVKLTSFQ